MSCELTMISNSIRPPQAGARSQKISNSSKQTAINLMAAGIIFMAQILMRRAFDAARKKQHIVRNQHPYYNTCGELFSHTAKSNFIYLYS